MSLPKVPAVPPLPFVEAPVVAVPGVCAVVPAPEDLGAGVDDVDDGLSALRLCDVLPGDDPACEDPVCEDPLFEAPL